MSRTLPWPVVPAAAISEISIGGTPARNVPAYWADGSSGHPWVSIADLRSQVVTATAEQISDLGVRNSNVKPVAAGTPLMSFKLTVGRVAVAGCDLFTNEAIAAFRTEPAKASSRWLVHVLPGAAAAVVTDTAVKGATLNKPKLAVLPIPLPPLPEQRLIAWILDTVDEVIRKTEEVIAKLQQMKQGLLHDLLTRGIDDNGELRDPDRHPEQFKDSSLGRIPKDWEVRSVREVARQVTDGDHHTPQRSDDGVLLLSARNVCEGYVDVSDVDYVPEAEYQRMIKRCWPQDGDILISCSGTIGRIAAVPRGMKCVLVRSAALVKPRSSELDTSYGVVVVSSDVVQRQIRAGQRQAVQSNLFQGEIAALLLPLPGLDEQQEIARCYDAFDIRLSAERAELDKLRLLKSGLMDDLLTGRVRVTHLLDDATR